MLTLKKLTIFEIIIRKLVFVFVSLVFISTETHSAITRFPLFLLHTFELPTDTFKVKMLLTIFDFLCETDAS
jgi:hypothetical protein